MAGHSKQALEKATAYVDQALAAQRDLGYREPPDRSRYERAVAEAAEAIEPLLRLVHDDTEDLAA